jgi:hypothetical protein
VLEAMPSSNLEPEEEGIRTHTPTRLYILVYLFTGSIGNAAALSAVRRLQQRKRPMGLLFRLSLSNNDSLNSSPYRQLPLLQPQLTRRRWQRLCAP